MDICTVAKINGNMGYMGVRIVVVEDEVAALKLRGAVYLCPTGIDSISCGGQPAYIDAALIKAVVYKPGAVKHIRTVSTQHIGLAKLRFKRRYKPLNIV